jgi:hypothetical protein
MTQTKRGRPENKDAVVLESLMKNEETRKAFKEKIDNLVYLKRRLNDEMEVMREDVSAVAESTGMSKGWLNKFVNSKSKGKEQELAEQGATFAEAVELLYTEGEGLC